MVWERLRRRREGTGQRSTGGMRILFQLWDNPGSHEGGVDYYPIPTLNRPENPDKLRVGVAFEILVIGAIIPRNNYRCFASRAQFCLKRIIVVDARLLLVFRFIFQIKVGVKSEFRILKAVRKPSAIRIEFYIRKQIFVASKDRSYLHLVTLRA